VGQSLANRILIVDDEAEIRGFIRRYLERDNYEVLEACNGREALERIGQFDLALVDVLMPEMDGFEFTRQLRKVSNVPVLILSALDEEIDQVAGLELGADDYITKPFRPRELLARVRAHLRHVRPEPEPASTGLRFDAQSRMAWWDAVRLDLTPREYDLLRLLATNPGKNYTREELLNRVWGEEYAGDARRVDVHISKIREKLQRAGANVPIRAIWGVGYRFEP
jgi:two-component system alkaline phosphatase synthesis response regulator PhoP